MTQGFANCGINSPVSLDYFDIAPFKFKGTIGQVQVKQVKWFLRFSCKTQGPLRQRGGPRIHDGDEN